MENTARKERRRHPGRPVAEAKRRIKPAFIPITGLKCSYGKISRPLTKIPVGKTEILETEPARPLTLTHRKFYNKFRGKAGQSNQPGSCEEAFRHRYKHVYHNHHLKENAFIEHFTS